MNLPHKRITVQERDYYLDQGGLNGSELRGISAPEKEFYNFVLLLIEKLKVFGVSGPGPDYPYYVSEDTPADYFPVIEISDLNALSWKLVELVHQAVLEMPYLYRVDICNAEFFLDEDFNFFVEHKAIYWYTDSETVERQL